MRDYQERGLAEIMTAFRGGAQRVLAVSPTGSGKTTLFTHLNAELAAANARSLILVHRRELATQAANRLLEFGVSFGFVMAGEPAKPYAPVQIASVQTLVRRARMPDAKLVICDEAHLSTAATWAKILEQYPAARVLGVTATPWRLSGKPLAGQYDACVVVASPRELREQGHLCGYAGFSYKTPDLSAVKTTAGDYNEKDSATAMGAPQIVDNIVEMWLKHASTLSTVVFAVTVEHSLTIVAKFREAGVSAEHLDGNTPPALRAAILKRVADGVTMVLCNVGVAVEGLDIPRLKCCVLARPTKSLARAIQMMGRVRRPWQGVTARIHDHSFNIKLHGLPDADRDYALDSKPEKPPSLTTCAQCLAMFEGRTCPSCATEAEPQIIGERKLRTVADAEQFEFDADSRPEETPEELKPPVEVTWNSPGRSITGRYIRSWAVKTDWGMQSRYLLRGQKRDYNLPGTSHLNALMSRTKTGDLLRVTFVSEQAYAQGKTKKVFKLEVDEPETPKKMPGPPPKWLREI